MKKMIILTAALCAILSVPSIAKLTHSENENLLLASGLFNRCVAGGEGATSCSIDKAIDLVAKVEFSCTVTCGEGYYACCRLTGCTCEKYQAPETEIQD